MKSTSPSSWRAGPLLKLLIPAVSALTLLGGCGGDDGPSSEIRLASLSSKPELVSGGDVLVQASVSGTADMGQVRFTLNGTDVTSRFTSVDKDKRTMTGLVTGLVDGNNTLNGSGPDAKGASLTLVSHPLTGPLLSGAQQKFYNCKTIESGLGAPLDANCSAPTQVVYFYKNTSGTFVPMSDPTARPADLAQTKTTTGATVPYVVRVESGTIARSIYRVAVLDNPTSASAGTWKPTASWNQRLVVSFGGGCGVHYAQGGNTVNMALSDVELSRGFAYAVSTALVNQQFCNPGLQGEALMMLKEHVIKTFGVPVWTAGVGGSGGSIQQLTLAQMYPGLLDGIQPSATFPDSQFQQPTDCQLLYRFFGAAPATWTADKRMAVVGTPDAVCADWGLTFANAAKAVPPAGNPANPLDAAVASVGGILIPDFFPCGVPDATLLYDAASNPSGIRCSVYEGWSSLTGLTADGKARRTWDNVGVQYGLKAVNSGAISVDEFLSLNESVGGLDSDGNPVAQRTAGDEVGIKNSYATGLTNGGAGGLPTIPIIHQRSYWDFMPAGLGAAEHDHVQDFVVRARLQRANGNSDNQIIWVIGPTSTVDLHGMALDLMARWLDAMAADTSELTAAKVVKYKPADATDACWDAAGNKISEAASYSDPNTQCNKLYPVHAEPRLVAGAPQVNDVMKCQLKPISAADYTVTFTAQQQARLAANFPQGVCDFSKPGVNQVPLAGTYLKLPL